LKEEVEGISGCSFFEREKRMIEKDAIDRLIYRVIGCMIEVHKQLGPGFLEKVYRRALSIELENQGIGFQAEKDIPLHYKGNNVGSIAWICSSKTCLWSN
jgi:hypothetical protein